MKRQLQVTPLAGYPPDIGRWLWALEDARRITRRTVEGLDVTPEWVAYHLVEHEVGHADQMRSLRRRADLHLGELAAR
jgi:hypothetical protein